MLSALLGAGQTGAGKSYTMYGANETFEHRGIVPRSISQIFAFVGERDDREISVSVSYMAPTDLQGNPKDPKAFQKHAPSTSEILQTYPKLSKSMPREHLPYPKSVKENPCVSNRFTVS